jgi:hypothetical protein
VNGSASIISTTAEQIKLNSKYTHAKPIATSRIMVLNMLEFFSELGSLNSGV